MDSNVVESEFQFIRLVGDERRVGTTLASVSRHWQGEKERFLFISPHDDDVVLGGGLLLQLAQREGVPVHILVVTDGSMGYCSPEEKDTISKIRYKETYECYQKLGVPKENIIWVGYPDCQLVNYCGRKLASPKDKGAIEGYTGLQNTFTYYLRKIRPTQCFLPTSNDLHPDHQITHAELLISLFHASGNIWPELGEPLEKVPFVHEMGVYCDFPEPPKLRMRAPESYLEKKLEGIACFKSQKQIGSLIDIVRKSGPEEYLRALRFGLYQPVRYRDLFEKKFAMHYIR
jgi:LmbE family N-acetylglucosaminyl deacetylase